MNYYPHHIGDFNNNTRHLTRIERSVYRDMIDLYYDTEQPLTLDRIALCRKLMARTEEEITAVEQVLSEFFTQTAKGWYHARCDEEINEYHINKSAKSQAGKASAAKKYADREARLEELNKTPTDDQHLFNTCSTPVQQVLNSVGSSVQLTSNQEPITSNQINTPIPPSGASTVEKKKSAISLKTFIVECKGKSEKPIPEDDPVFEYSRTAGIPDEFLWLQWREFIDRYRSPDAKRYKDWRSVFRKSVRGNWFRLWYFDGNGNYVLTTQGIQAKNIHKAKAA